MATRTTLGDALAGDEEAANKPHTVKVAGKADEGKVIKLTIELAPALHRTLKSFALLKADDASLADVVRAAISVLDKNPKLAKAVIDEIEHVTTKHRR